MIDRDAFDLFQFLGKLSRGDMNAFKNLSPEGKKAAHPFVIMRWMAGTKDRAQIVRINEFCNRYTFALGEHKDLLFKLLAASATGSTNRYTWLKGPGQTSNKLAVKAIAEKYAVSTREAQEYMELLDSTDVVRCAEELGWTKEELKKLALELGKEDGPRPPAKKRSKSKD